MTGAGAWAAGAGPGCVLGTGAESTVSAGTTGAPAGAAAGSAAGT